MAARLGAAGMGPGVPQGRWLSLARGAFSREQRVPERYDGLSAGHVSPKVFLRCEGPACEAEPLDHGVRGPHVS